MQKGEGMTENYTEITIDRENERGKVSDTLYGIFIEDINFACDGGLNANMLRNYSFDDCYLKNKKLNMIRFITKTTGRITSKPDRLRYWNWSGGKVESSNAFPVTEKGWYARIISDGDCKLTNHGYNGDAHENPAISVKEGETFEFSFYVRSEDFAGEAEVYVTDQSGEALTTAAGLTYTDCWSLQTVQVTGMKTNYGIFTLHLIGSGCICIDCLQFYHTDTWHAGDARWSQGKLRRDLVEALADLNPKFLRFPGGCLVEGIADGNEYQWKKSVGPILEREPDFNLRATQSSDNGYMQSLQIGFYEYFLLCEDLGMEPLPVVWAGLNCQQRKRGKISVDAPDFYERVIQNALDLIEFANGDPKESPWAKIRADAGHPEPFHIKFIGIGNENVGEDYLNRFKMIKDAIDERYDGITCILSAGGLSQGDDFDAAWKFANEICPDVYIDEHMYKKPASIIENAHRYDQYSREGAKVFIGEYAAFDILNFKLIPNQYDTALAEAAFYTGMERNADVIRMFCYAPLFSLVNGSHWKHNLIYYNPKTLVKSVNYQVHWMFSANIGSQILEIPELPENLFVSATADDEAIYVKLVNIGESDMKLKLRIENFNISEKNVYVLKTPSLGARNTLSFTGKPEYEVKMIMKKEEACQVEEVIMEAYTVCVMKLT